METTSFDAVVLAAGDFPSHPQATCLLDHPRVVCCDSAATDFIRSGRMPWRVIGDGDSIAEDTRVQVPFICISEQDTNDLSKAMRLLRSEGMRRVAIIGATGRREDHTLGNISLLIEYMRQGFDVVMVTDYGIFRPLSGTQTLEAGVGQQISVINFTCSAMRNEGLRYQFPPLTNWWMGTLNEAIDTRFTIEADGEYLVYWAYA